MVFGAAKRFARSGSTPWPGSPTSAWAGLLRRPFWGRRRANHDRAANARVAAAIVIRLCVAMCRCPAVVVRPALRAAVVAEDPAGMAAKPVSAGAAPLAAAVLFSTGKAPGTSEGPSFGPSPERWEECPRSPPLRAVLRDARGPTIPCSSPCPSCWPLRSISSTLSGCSNSWFCTLSRACPTTRGRPELLHNAPTRCNRRAIRGALSSTFG